MSYAEFGRRVERISAWLAHHGVAAGHTVAIWAPNTPPWAACALATMHLGAAVTALNPSWTAEEAARQVGDAGCDGRRHDPASWLGWRPRWSGSGTSWCSESDARGTGLRDVLACEHATPPAATDQDAVALLPYSSGTTGLPEGRPAHAHQPGDHGAAGAGGSTIHRAGHGPGAGPVLPRTRRRRHAWPCRWPSAPPSSPSHASNPTLLLDVIERHRISLTAIPPPVAAFLAHHPAVAGRNLSSLQLLAVGGAPLPVPVHRAVAARLPGCVVAQGWGLTETTASICVPDRINPARPAR